jgi:hypothetical protein
MTTCWICLTKSQMLFCYWRSIWLCRRSVNHFTSYAGFKLLQYHFQSCRMQTNSILDENTLHSVNFSDRQNRKATHHSNAVLPGCYYIDTKCQNTHGKFRLNFVLNRARPAPRSDQMEQRRIASEQRLPELALPPKCVVEWPPVHLVLGGAEDGYHGIVPAPWEEAFTRAMRRHG